MLALFHEKNSSFVIQRHLLLKVLSAQEERKDVLLVVHIIVISIVISIKKRLYSTQRHLFLLCWSCRLIHTYLLSVLSFVRFVDVYNLASKM